MVPAITEIVRVMSTMYLVRPSRNYCCAQIGINLVWCAFCLTGGRSTMIVDLVDV